MPQQRGFDLARLDPEAAQLHLRVGPAQEVQHAIAAPARQVAGAVHPAARRPIRIGHEPLRRQTRASQITPRQTQPRDVQLARHASRNRLQAAVQHVDLKVGQTGRPIRLPVFASTVERSSAKKLTCTVVSVMPYMLHQARRIVGMMAIPFAEPTGNRALRHRR